MKKKAGIIILMAVLAALVVSGAVFAEGDEPPAAPVECGDCNESAPTAEIQQEEPPEQAAGDESSSPELLEEPAADEEIVEEPVENLDGDIDQEPVMELQEPASEETVEATAPGEVQETEIVLLDDQGEPLDMASQESAEILAFPDPYFKIGTTYYRFFAGSGVCASLYFGDPYCFDGQGDNVIQDAIDYISDWGTIPTDKKIYIDSGTYGTADVYINGSNSYLSTINGLIGKNTEGTNPIINGNIEITNLAGGFTLKGFTINGTVSIVNCAGSLLLEDLVVKSGTDTGIKIGSQSFNHQGAATLKDVKSNENFGKGAQIYAMGNITITNSSFDLNGVDGVNTEDGLYLDTKAGTITIQGVSASHNTGTGIRSIDFKKAVTLKQLLVNNNNNGGLSFTDPAGMGAFLIDTLYASNNAVQNGVYIQTKGAITLNKVMIENSGTMGLYLDHWTSAAPIVLSEISSNFNSAEGIYITTLGSVTGRSVRADNNEATGMEIYNQYSGALGTITINSPAAGGPAAANSFSYNVGGGSGLSLQSNKNITLSNLDAMGNDSFGLEVSTPASLTIGKTLPNWVNAFDGNGNSGIDLSIGGNVVLGYVRASGNGGYGVNLNDVAKNVTVTGGMFDNNGDTGLRIRSSGNVVLSDVDSASYNDAMWEGYEYGINIDATYGIGTVTLKSTSKTAMTWISGNSGDGLSIGANGAISVTGVYADSNGGSGVYINNQYTGVAKTVTVARTQGNYNGNAGLRVSTAGNVTLTDLYMDGNGDEGARVIACKKDGSGGCLTIANVTLKGYNGFSNNIMGYGLWIETKGTINLGQLNVMGNGGGGVYVNNAYPGATAPVTMGGTYSSFFRGNGSFGVDAESNGLITLKNLIVQDTYDISTDGAISLINNGGTSTKGITLMDVRIFGSEGTGLFIGSNGPITLQGVESSYNSVYSGWIDEDLSTNGVIERLSGYWNSEGDEWHFMGESIDNYTITLTSSEFTPMLVLMDEWGNWLAWDDDNWWGEDTAQITFSPDYDGEYILRVMALDWGVGVYELTFGGIVEDLLASSQFRGADIETPAAVSITSGKTVFSYFEGNNADGLYIVGGSTVAISNAGASNNYRDGVFVYAPNNNVTIGNNHKTRFSYFNGNGGNGITVLAGGNITLNNQIRVYGSGLDGIYLEIIGTSLPKNITVKGATANGNGAFGLNMDATGNISLTSIEASSNVVFGIYAQAVGNLTIAGTNVFSDNSETGLYFDVLGSVNISGVTADHNGTNGIEGYANTALKTVTIKNSLLRWNDGDGLWLQSAGNVTLDGVQSFMNGGDGVDIDPTYSITTLIKNSTFMGNGEYGIKVLAGYYTITNTFYLANDWGGIFLYH